MEGLLFGSSRESGKAPFRMMVGLPQAQPQQQMLGLSMLPKLATKTCHAISGTNINVDEGPLPNS